MFGGGWWRWRRGKKDAGSPRSIGATSASRQSFARFYRPNHTGLAISVRHFNASSRGLPLCPRFLTKTPEMIARINLNTPAAGWCWKATSLRKSQTYNCWKTSPQRYHVMRLAGGTSWQESDQSDNFDCTVEVVWNLFNHLYRMQAMHRVFSSITSIQQVMSPGSRLTG